MRVHCRKGIDTTVHTPAHNPHLNPCLIDLTDKRASGITLGKEREKFQGSEEFPHSGRLTALPDTGTQHPHGFPRTTVVYQAYHTVTDNIKAHGKTGASWEECSAFTDAHGHRCQTPNPHDSGHSRTHRNDTKGPSHSPASDPPDALRRPPTLALKGSKGKGLWPKKSSETPQAASPLTAQLSASKAGQHFRISFLQGRF